MKAKIQNNKIVAVGDCVSFKDDYEMSGVITEINYTKWNNNIKEITIETGGSDPEYEETHVLLASDCWVE